MHSHTNRLIRETSPYLLQHAHNPVDWYPWSEEAFEKAKKEDKPVLVSIGYAACHWCHVMERESFEDEKVAAYMNEHFVNIKVDREERPDVDHIYMDAVQAITGSGGWPLNVFLTPDKKPFYGGTYFPPTKAFNRPSWLDILRFIDDAYKNRKQEVEEQAESLTQHLAANTSFVNNLPNETIFNGKNADEAFESIMKTADRDEGGFGRAPKFPQTFIINFLLHYAHVRKNNEALDQALLSLDKMIMGGIYDHLGGGFARYSTDNEWLAPHFEKMLYDNALIVSSLAEAYQMSRKEIYKQVIEETLAFTERELMDKSGGFYSALDADSEGEEGKFYVWNHEEVKDLLGEEAQIFCDYYDITPKGNWEGKNILRNRHSLNEFSKQKNISKDELKNILSRSKQKLFERRVQRVRPGLDDKIILGWNALMNIAYCKAFAATENEHFRHIAERNMSFLLSAYRTENHLLHHTWKNGEAKHPAFLDDYALLIAALIELSQVSGNNNYLDHSKELTETVLNYFGDEQSPLLFYTYYGQKDVLIRKKEVYDGATPSGNSVMAYNLYKLSIFFDKKDWRYKAEQLVGSMSDVIIKYPTSFGHWLSLFFEVISGTYEIALTGKNMKNYLGKLLNVYTPHKVVQSSVMPLFEYPLLADKPETSEIRIYVCENYACQKPVSTIAEFVALPGHK